MSMLDEDEEYEDDVLYERRGTPVVRSARPELIVPTSSMSWRWPGAPNLRLWPRACAATGTRASMVMRKSEDRGARSVVSCGVAHSWAEFVAPLF